MLRVQVPRWQGWHCCHSERQGTPAATPILLCDSVLMNQLALLKLNRVLYHPEDLPMTSGAAIMSCLSLPYSILYGSSNLYSKETKAMAEKETREGDFHQKA